MPLWAYPVVKKEYFMSGISGLVGLFVAQSVVVFAGISTILGRVYFQSYYDALGIPQSALTLSMAEYSIIEPQITLLGIGVAIYAPLFFLFLTFFQRARPFDNSRHFIGSVLMTAPLLLMVGIPPSGATFLVLYAAVIAIPLGGSMVASGTRFEKFGHNGADSDEKESGAVSSNLIRGTATGFLLLVVFTMGFLVTKNYSSAFAEIKAELTLGKAPSAILEFSPDAQWFIRGVRECSEVDPKECAFRVVLFADRFVYLSPVSHDPQSPTSGLYAVPLDDVKYIRYLH